ncbi:MAG TPA: 5-methyltetrahydropteroyltriglutamate--homocysteine S-methyltransferase [Trebonia sp.]
MTRRDAPPFRADHVGSLLRPAALLAARDAFASGKTGGAGISAAELTAAEDDAIRAAVKLQEDAGLRAATDGEFRREQWHADFLYAIPGIDRGELGPALPVYRPDETIHWAPNATLVTDKVHLDQTIFGEHFTFLKNTVTTAVPKITVPSPSMVHFRVDLAPGLYSGPEEYRADVAAVYAAEVAGLYALGARYVQYDDTIFAFLNDPGWRASMAGTVDVGRQHEINVEVINSSLRHKPADLAVTLHMCRGNYRSAWFSSGGYDYVAEAVFGGLEVDGLFLEYDDERSGSFTPLRFVPDDQTVVLGLVTTKTPGLESKDTLKRRIEEASRYVDLERLCLSGQCGFASTVEGNVLTLDEEKAKLDLIVEVADEVWG